MLQHDVESSFHQAGPVVLYRRSLPTPQIVKAIGFNAIPDLDCQFCSVTVDLSIFCMMCTEGIAVSRALPVGS